MKKNFDSYRRIGHRFVSGWLESEVLTILKVLNTAQRAKNLSGAVTEIGVHHGKLFIGLHLLQQDTERSLAIDVFSDQELNVDNSGRGNLARFRRNVERWSTLQNVAIHQGDSTQLEAHTLRTKAGADVRLFSVDGGHTESIVFSDMKLAEACVCDGGIVIADDVFNQAWPGVSLGTFRYLEQNGALVPFAIGFNKVFFARAEYATYYREALEKAFGKLILTSVRRSHFGKYPVTIIARVPRRPRRLAGRFGVVKTLYSRFQRSRDPN